jgi:hypothetical protein
MDNFLLGKDERSLEAMIARMAARDGLLFTEFVSSPDQFVCLFVCLLLYGTSAQYGY